MQKTPVVELKGGMYTLLSLRLHSTDISAIDAGLADKVKQAPGFFSNTPVVIDVTRIEDQPDFDAEAVISKAREHQLMPILLNVANRETALEQNLSLPAIETSSRNVPMPSGKKRTSSKKKASGSGEQASLLHKPSATRLKEKALATAIGDDDESDELDNTADTGSQDDTGDAADMTASGNADTGSFDNLRMAPPKLVTRPVRSGQQLYARDADLIIMAHVGPGAEIVADNNIHVYGPLRGRALCGVTGNSESRIFCQSLEAELVSVAGNYKVLEEIPEELFGKPAQIWFEDGRLNIDPL